MPAVHQVIPDLAAALNMTLPKIAEAARRVLSDLGVEPARLKQELAEWVAPVQRRHRRIGTGKTAGRACSFCGCKDLGPLVAGPGVWICGSCAQTALDILLAEPRGLRTG